MAQIIKEITLDVSKNNLFQAIVAKQHDTDSRFLKATICDDGTKINISSTSIAVINAERADGESKAFSGTVNDDGTITVPLTGWMLELDDTIRCSVSIIEEGHKLTTTSFTISVESAEIDDSTISEDENHDLLVTLIGECSTAKAECETAAAAAADANKMKLIRKITTTEAVSSLVISTDEEGNAISLDRFCLILTLPSAVSVSAGGITILCNGTSSSHYAYYNTETTSVKHARFEGECMGDTTGADGAVRHWTINYALGSAQGYGNTLKTERYMFAVPTINKLTFKMALPSDAVLVLYGRSGG